MTLNVTTHRRRQTREQREWTLFTDWCSSMSVSSLPAASETVAQFLAAFPASMDAHGHRVRTIRRAHERAGVAFDIPSPPHTALQIGDEWAPLPEALSNLQPYQHPKYVPAAVRARRDGWLLVIIGFAGLTREEAQVVAETDVSLFPRLAVRGVDIPRASSPDECCACAVTRWLRVVYLASWGQRTELVETVSPGQDQTAHDCRVGLDGTWRKAKTLLPSINQYGHVLAEPLSLRSITTIMKRRQRVRRDRDLGDQKIRTVATGRFAQATPNELADAYDDVDQQLAAILLRSTQILQESDEMLERISDLSRPVGTPRPND